MALKGDFYKGFPQPSVTCCQYMSRWAFILLVRGLRRLLSYV
jgi:hypothetical protein